MIPEGAPGRFVRVAHAGAAARHRCALPGELRELGSDLPYAEFCELAPPRLHFAMKCTLRIPDPLTLLVLRRRRGGAQLCAAGRSINAERIRAQGGGRRRWHLHELNRGQSGSLTPSWRSRAGWPTPPTSSFLSCWLGRFTVVDRTGAWQRGYRGSSPGSVIGVARHPDREPLFRDRRCAREHAGRDHRADSCPLLSRRLGLHRHGRRNEPWRRVRGRAFSQPFSIVIAQQVADVPRLSGWAFRTAFLVLASSCGSPPRSASGRTVARA